MRGEKSICHGVHFLIGERKEERGKRKSKRGTRKGEKKEGRGKRGGKWKVETRDERIREGGVFS